MSNKLSTVTSYSDLSLTRSFTVNEKYIS